MRQRWFLLLPVALGLAACEPWSDVLKEELVDAPIFRALSVDEPTSVPGHLRVMTWNVKYGGGRLDFFFDGWGDRTEMSLDEVRANLEANYQLIEEVKPDILMVQEIEVNSRRSAYVDMVQDLLDNTSMNYGAYYPVWDTRYAPDEAFGRVEMGNAIFSRFPITEAQRHRSADRTDQAFYEDYFLLHRGIGRAVLDVGGRELAAWVVHAEAYDDDGTKKKHVDQALELFTAETLPAVIGGDFNNLPPGTVKTEAFNDDPPDLVGTRYETPPYELDAMDGFFTPDFLPAIDTARYGTAVASQERYYTHTVIGPAHTGTDGEPAFWNRKLDYLFIKNADRWIPATTDVIQAAGRGPVDIAVTVDPMELSDHCPVVGNWEPAP
ncbi:MAG: endonuclease/exonuclease/phosphatase family protein [Deltaproteobacteria bacterium]|nr:endonuclease/exonuclease/phosphatase family protein [Deltaproteobacteria bacterium]